MPADAHFEVKPRHFTPIVVVIIIATGLAATLQFAYVSPPSTATPFSESGSGPMLNALYFVGIIAAAGTGIYFLTRLGLAKALRTLMAVVYVLVSLAVATLYWPIAFWILRVPLNALYDLLLLTATAATVAVVVYGVFVRKGGMRSSLLLFLGGALGAMLGFSIPTLSALLILMLLAAYDVFAVYVGPVGKLVGEGRMVSAWGLSVVFADLEIGLGDLVFYSMLTSHVLINFGPLPFAAATVSVLVGVYLTFKMLERRKVFPGLPFSLSFGIAAVMATRLIVG